MCSLQCGKGGGFCPKSSQEAPLLHVLSRPGMGSLELLVTVVSESAWLVVLWLVHVAGVCVFTQETYGIFED